MPWAWKMSRKVVMAEGEMGCLGGWTDPSDYLEKSVLARDLVSYRFQFCYFLLSLFFLVPQNIG